MIGLPVVIGVTTALMRGAQAGLTQQRLGHYAADYARVLSHGGEPRGLTPPTESVGVEVCNYGGLTKLKDGTFLNYVNKPVPADQVCDLGYVWRGYRYYHAYTDAQLAELEKVIPYLHELHGIALEKGRVFTAADFETDIAKFAKRAVNFHVNFRADKNDMSPQPKLIAMLNRVHA